MNSEINKKTPAFIYAKEFQLSKVLGNLQAYKVATGDVGQTEQEKAARKHGNNLGALYGNLITKAALTTESNKRQQDKHESDEGPSKRRRRQKGNNKHKKKKDGGPRYPVPVVTSQDLDEPLPLPQWLQQVEEDQPKEESDESSENETVDFLGLSTGQDEESSSEDSCPNDSVVESPTRCITNTSHSMGEDESSERLRDKIPQALTTYVCSRCKRRGHLPEHCTIPQTTTGNNYHQRNIKNTSHSRADIQDLFLQCRRLKHSRNTSCTECENTSNLAFCFECRLTLCDGRGHLIEHLLNFPTHTQLFSHKLKKLLKCSNASCDVVDIDKLLVCPQCLSKIFDKQYSLINATWSDRGLQAITRVICCEEHFHWHRMNCYNSSGEVLFNRESLLKLKQERNGLLSEFFF